MINLNDLDDDQRAAATAPRGPVCILAGAGTGKTRTITYRIAHLINSGFVSPNRVLAVTFTARAAGEMRHRLSLMGIGGVQARTFHAAARRQLQYFWPQIAGDLPWQLIDNKFPLVGRAIRNVGVESTVDTVRDVLSEIEWAKASLIPPESYVERIAQTHRTPPLPAETIAHIYSRYEQSKMAPEGILLDFDDLLIHTAGALENSPGVAEEFRAQYRTFVVDEYQDVTPLQQRVLEGWLGERDDLTVVGDANQTIYSFTGATPSYLLNFSRTYPHAVTTRLQRDYRSTPQITELANTVIGKATGRVAGTRLELMGMRPAGPKPEYHGYDDEPTEAREIAGKILTLIQRGVSPSEIAVLYRINAQSAVFEQALADAGVVYQVRGGEGFFHRPEIRQAITQLIRAAADNKFPEDALGEQLHLVARAILAPIGLTPSEPSGAQARERWQSLNALVELIAELGRATPDLDIHGALRQLKERAESKHPPTMEGVTLASLHAAKGLEWDAVFLVGLVDGTLPITHAIKAGEENIEEERRLFYVGITRAREYLHCSWALARQEGGRKSRTRTRFLDGIAPEIEPISAPAKNRTKKCRVCGMPLESAAAKVLGRCEDCPSEADAATFDALRAWRSEIAREQGVPAYIVFSDATLTSVAERMPTNEAELLDVPGIGPVKVERYGASLLRVLEKF